jgi:hypothetical protein
MYLMIQLIFMDEAQFWTGASSVGSRFRRPVLLRARGTQKSVFTSLGQSRTAQ